jgi:hypothetical protein
VAVTKLSSLRAVRERKFVQFKCILIKRVEAFADDKTAFFVQFAKVSRRRVSLEGTCQAVGLLALCFEACCIIIHYPVLFEVALVACLR